MRRIIIILFLLGLSVNPIFAKKVALLIGVGNIPENTLHTKEDILTMKSLVRGKFDIISIEDSQATYKNVKSALKKLYTLKKSDTVLFYYSGHGCRAYGSVDEKDSKDEFLMLSGVKYRDDGFTIKSGIMLDDELNYHFSKIKAKKIILFDCCHSATMYKSLSPIGSKYSKTFETIFTLGYKKNPLYFRHKVNNFIKLSACLDSQQSEDSPKGGIFTLTLQKVLKERGNIPFSQLINEIKNSLHPVAEKYGRAGNYVPNMDAKNINPKKTYTKDIFAIKKPRKYNTLEDYLNTKNALTLSLQTGVNRFSIGDNPIFKSTLKDSKNHLYLLEVDNNNYKTLAHTTVDKCMKDGEKRVCYFENIISSVPFGESKVYLISTPHPLDINRKSYGKDFRETLKSQLKHVPFKVGKVSVFAVP